jgi:hypothetical protein
MHTPYRDFAAPVRRRTTVCVAIVAMAVGWAPALAHADGDPASDVLVSQTMFLPWDAGVSAKQQAQLEAVLEAAARAGFEIRVAVIASSPDMGSVTALWHRPRSYAQFLGEELSLVYGGRLLVVMPGGFGLYRPGRPLAAEQAALAQARPPAGAVGTAAATIAAIERLAAVDGHAVPLTSAPVPSAAGAGSGSSDTLSWIVFVLGGGLIALAWSASLRARPLHR